jgi:hypothetical protein
MDTRIVAQMPMKAAKCLHSWNYGGILIRLRIALDHKRKFGRETPTPTARTQSSRPIRRWVIDPPIEVRFAPTAAMFAELHLRRKGAILHLAVYRGAAETGAL